MVETKKTAAPSPGKKDGGVKRRKNPDKEKKNWRSLGDGMYKYGRYRKVSAWTFVGKKPHSTKSKPKKKLTVEKEIGGDKNGKKRIVNLIKKTAAYPTTDRIRKHPAKTCFKQHKRRVRSSLVPGRVVIILAGINKGHRAIVCGVLKSGLLLVNGPFTLNGVCLRRMHKSYVIATSTQINFNDVKIPEHINDEYFKRVHAKRPKKVDGDIFVQKKEPYKPSEQRKEDQKVVDKELLKAIKKEKDHKLIRKYLCTMFGLRSNMYPHKMKF